MIRDALKNNSWLFLSNWFITLYINHYLTGICICNDVSKYCGYCGCSAISSCRISYGPLQFQSLNGTFLITALYHQKKVLEMMMFTFSVQRIIQTNIHCPKWLNCICYGASHYKQAPSIDYKFAKVVNNSTIQNIKWSIQRNFHAFLIPSIKWSCVIHQIFLFHKPILSFYL